jgi:hypothetical protein
MGDESICVHKDAEVLRSALTEVGALSVCEGYAPLPHATAE